MFSDKIRSAGTEQEIYLLLTSYIEAVWLSDKSHGCIPAELTRLPLNGVADVRERFNRLMLELDGASKRLDDDACAHVREGVHIFSFALNRLSMFNVQRCGPQSVSAPGFDAHAA
jgi:hypothetical protein